MAWQREHCNFCRISMSASAAHRTRRLVGILLSGSRRRLAATFVLLWRRIDFLHNGILTLNIRRGDFAHRTIACRRRSAWLCPSFRFLKLRGFSHEVATAYSCGRKPADWDRYENKAAKRRQQDWNRKELLSPLRGFRFNLVLRSLGLRPRIHAAIASRFRKSRWLQNFRSGVRVSRAAIAVLGKRITDPSSAPRPRPGRCFVGRWWVRSCGPPSSKPSPSSPASAKFGCCGLVLAFFLLYNKKNYRLGGLFRVA